jgi:hypothetical protein
MTDESFRKWLSNEMTAFLVKASASILRQCLNEETMAKLKSFPARLRPCMCFEANDKRRSDASWCDDGKIRCSMLIACSKKRDGW